MPTSWIGNGFAHPFAEGSTPHHNYGDVGLSASDWAVILIAVAALGVSLWTAAWTRRTARRSLYVDLEARLTDLDSQEGRRLLNMRVTGPESPAELFSDHPEDFNKINRAMSLMSTLGTYTQLRYVERSVVLRHWRANVVNSWQRIEWWVDIRQSSSQVPNPEKFADLIRLGVLCGAPVSSKLRVLVR
jgi:hypothetical protein